MHVLALLLKNHQVQQRVPWRMLYRSTLSTPEMSSDMPKWVHTLCFAFPSRAGSRGKQSKSPRICGRSRSSACRRRGRGSPTSARPWQTSPPSTSATSAAGARRRPTLGVAPSRGFPWPSSGRALPASAVVEGRRSRWCCRRLSPQNSHLSRWIFCWDGRLPRV